MTIDSQLAPNVKPDDRVVLFDGVCRLCAMWSKFLIRFDKKHLFKLCTVQSAEGQKILAWYGLPMDNFDTMILLEGSRIYTKSTAFIHVVAYLPWPWRFAAVAWLIPRPIRDWLYDRVARNRYSIFGKYESCMLPTPDHDRRFLSTADI